MRSPRLTYRPVGADDLDVFHALVVDPHVRRYLLDGAVMPRAWSAERIAGSDALFARLGVGLWLVRDPNADDVIGFCGFLDSDETEPPVVYALLEPHTGRGLATEMARASVAAGRAAGLAEILADADAGNVASVRVLERLGFTRVGTTAGANGEHWTYRLAAGVFR